MILLVHACLCMHHIQSLTWLKNDLSHKHSTTKLVMHAKESKTACAEAFAYRHCNNYPVSHRQGLETSLTTSSSNLQYVSTARNF